METATSEVGCAPGFRSHLLTARQEGEPPVAAGQLKKFPLAQAQEQAIALWIATFRYHVSSF
jgi:hypothetical protein